MKRILSLILVLCLLVSVFTALPLTASAATEDLAAAGETSGGFEYAILDDGTASITGYSGGDSAVVIPSQIDSLTRIVTLKPTKPKAGEYTITVTDAVNYAGVKGSVSAKVTADDVPLYILGDVDGDGEITIIDATSIQRFLAELPTPWAFIPEAADADGDNDITIVDATAIQRYLADLPTHPGIGEPI